LITDYKMATNNTSDVEIIKNRMDIIKDNTDVEDLYADGGFYSEEVIAQAQKQRINLPFTEMTGKKPLADRIALSRFSINEQLKVVKCPNDKEPVRSNYDEKKNTSSCHFSLDDCKDCPFRPICPVKKQKKSFVLRITKKAIMVAEVR
jgi:hypothetical protein